MPERVLSVQDWRLERRADGVVVSAVLGDDSVWFTLPAGTPVPERGDAFLAVGLIHAMALGARFDLTALPPVSPQLLRSAEQIQGLLAAWNADLQPVEVRANTAAGAVSGQPGNYAMFSGGVDAIHTALHANAPRPEDAFVLINGFDAVLTPENFGHLRGQCERLAARFGTRLLPVETNWVLWRRACRLSGALTHGGCLAAVGLLFAPDQVTISSSNSAARMTPWGTHPLLDPRWSTEHTRFRHFGTPWNRAEKIGEIAEHPDLVASLQVCHREFHRNCGQCNKCIRTGAALHLLGLRLPSAHDPLPDPVRAFAKVARGGYEYAFVEELRDLARETGHPAEAQLLERARRAQVRRRVVRAVRDRWFPGISRRKLSTVDLSPWGRRPPPESE